MKDRQSDRRTDKQTDRQADRKSIYTSTSFCSAQIWQYQLKSDNKWGIGGKAYQKRIFLKIVLKRSNKSVVEKTNQNRSRGSVSKMHPKDYDEKTKKRFYILVTIHF